MNQLFLFVRPPRPLWPFNSPASAFWPPLAFASLAASLREKVPDLRVEILDAPALEMGWRTLAAEIHLRRPAFVGLGEEAVSCVEGLRLARLAKAAGARVIAGGCFFGHVAPEALATGLIDAIVHGEGEGTLIELVEALRDGSPEALARVPGISFLEGDPAAALRGRIGTVDEPSHGVGKTVGGTAAKPQVSRPWSSSSRAHLGTAAKVCGDIPSPRVRGEGQGEGFVSLTTGGSGPAPAIGLLSPALSSQGGEGVGPQSESVVSGCARTRPETRPVLADPTPAPPPGPSSRVVTTPPRQLLPDLDALPFPAYDLLPVRAYGARSLNHPRLAAIELGRGCFGSCDFCVLWRQMGRLVGDRLVPHLRVKSPERLLEEIRILVRRYDRAYLGWVDPCFNADPRVPGQLAELLLRDGLRVGQSAWARTDALVRDAHSGALDQCVRAGLNELYLGIERPDAAGLTALRKTSGIDHARQALQILRDEFPQVLAIGSFIYGLPGDSPATVRAIHRLAIELELDQFFFIPLTPLPGTSGWQPELWDPTGERFREFNFLPTGRPHGRFAALERALLFSLLLNWPPARLRAHLRRLFGGDARKRRVHRRLHARAVRFHLGRVFRSWLGSGQDLGLIFPRWYES